MGGENFPEQEREKPLTREGYRALRYTDVRPDPACRPTGEKSGTQLRRLCPSAAGDGAGTRGGGADPPASGHGPGSDGGNGAAALRNWDAGAAPASGTDRGVAGASSWGGAGGKASGQPGNYAAASAAGDGKTGKQRRI